MALGKRKLDYLEDMFVGAEVADLVQILEFPDEILVQPMNEVDKNEVDKVEALPNSMSVSEKGSPSIKEVMLIPELGLDPNSPMFISAGQSKAGKELNPKFDINPVVIHVLNEDKVKCEAPRRQWVADLNLNKLSFRRCYVK